MSERSGANWIMATTMAVAILVPGAMVTGLLIGARGSDAADARPSAPSAAQAASDDSTTRTDSVKAANPTDMIDVHHAMMDQMRASLSSSMNELMNRDPMWQMMRSTNYIAQLEQHERDIDRMLAKGDG